jgi:uncharacterized protein YjbI with pentapeptide repeats
MKIKASNDKSKLKPIEYKRTKFLKQTFTADDTVAGFFRKCEFVDCTFQNFNGFFLYFVDCTFKGCYFRNIFFSHIDIDWSGNSFEKCHLRHCLFEEGEMFDCHFIDTEFDDVKFAGIFPMLGVTFSKCGFSSTEFFTVAYNDPKLKKRKVKEMEFEHCNLNGTIFSDSDLDNTRFRNCKLWGATFLNCRVGKTTFSVTEKFEKDNPKAIAANFDLLTIKKSINVGKPVLRKFLGVPDDSIFNAAIKMESKLEYFSAFISYSFKDKQFAMGLYEHLKAHGITCFLWEKDTPGGQYLKEVMSSQIKKHEKIIFISSDASLKSEACQFELTEGRNKQNLNWKEIFLPVYIDDFLFSVREHQVRPLDKAQEYWKNIVELRTINCIKATDHSTPAKRATIFESVVQALKK